MTTSWLDALPEAIGPARDAYILDAARAGTLVLEWATVTTTSRGHTAQVQVLADAAYVVLDDGARFRPMASATLCQHVADLCGAYLPTSLLFDAAWRARDVDLAPVLFPVGMSEAAATAWRASGGMTRKSTCVDFNARVEAKRAGRGGIVRDVGKAWLASPLANQRRGCAVNLGYYGGGPYTTASGIRAWQTLGTAHDVSHVDASQLVQLAASACIVDGAPRDLQDVALDPELCGLVSADGPLTLRSPWVPRLAA